MIEKVIKMQLESYCEKSNVFSKYQQGFRNIFSYETTLNYVINTWKYIIRKKKILATLLDFKRAFETIDRNILLKKFHNCGIHENELKWFKSYLTDKKQMVKVDNI